MTPPTVQFIPASGLSLIIHDTFSGSGSIVGRTPDTVSNGNTWEVLEPDVGFTVSSGGVQRTTRSSTSPDTFLDSCVINVGTTGPLRIEITADYVASGVSSNGSGIVLWDTSGSLDDATAVRWGYSANEHRIQEWEAGVFNLPLAQDDNKFSRVNQTFIHHVEFDGSTIVSTLYNSSMTQLSQISTSSYVRTPSAKCGITFGSNNIVSTAVTDFKVYA